MENHDPYPFFPFQEDDHDLHIPMIASPDVMNYFSHENVVQGITFADVIDKQPNISEEIISRGGTPSTNTAIPKKTMHRDIEKQRRKEMATLYASLRSLVPARFLKGKRSVSDQIHEAATYIRCLQRNIRVLGDKRDNIKGMSSTKEILHASSDQGGSCSTMASRFSVSAEPCSVGVEIVISGEFIMDDGLLTLPTSRVLKLLSEEGLVVVCCNWTNSDGKLRYAIQSEVLDYADVNLQTLQRNLSDMINSLIDINRRSN